MNAEQFEEKLRQELSGTQSNMQYMYVKSLLSQIDDPAELQKAEIILGLFISIGSKAYPQKAVVVLIHGIRTAHGPWQDRLRQLLSTSSLVSEAYPIGYGYFDVVRFITHTLMPINRITREIRNIKNNHSNDSLVVVAHSFGTYLIAQTLLKHTDITPTRLLLCGSVLKSSFRWDKIPNYHNIKILNDCGTRDIWPLLAGQASWGYGSSGISGFRTSYVTDRFHNLQHSGYFDDQFMSKYWVPFIENGVIVNSAWNYQRSEATRIQTLLGWMPLKLIIVCSIFLIIMMIIR